MLVASSEYKMGLVSILDTDDHQNHYDDSDDDDDNDNLVTFHQTMCKDPVMVTI